MWILWLTSPVAFGGPPDALPVEARVAGPSSWTGTWRMDWTRSTGFQEMMVALGLPRFIVSFAEGSNIRVQFSMDGANIHMKRKLPIATMQELWIPDGEWREESSKLGDHKVRTIVEGGRVTQVRQFPEATLTDTWFKDGSDLRFERTLVRPGQEPLHALNYLVFVP